MIHLAIVKAHRMRHCHYCSAPAPVAFYCQALSDYSTSKWACPDCYIQCYVPVHGGQHTTSAASPHQELVSAAS